MIYLFAQIVKKVHVNIVIKMKCIAILVLVVLNQANVMYLNLLKLKLKHIVQVV